MSNQMSPDSHAFSLQELIRGIDCKTSFLKVTNLFKDMSLVSIWYFSLHFLLVRSNRKHPQGKLDI